MGTGWVEKFAETADLLRCPLCKGKLWLDGGSLRCGKGHCFDLSSKGYVNFLPGQKSPGHYNRAFFESRRRILEAGFYDHLLEGLLELPGVRQAKVVLDAGCGEGYYAKAVKERLGVRVLALDYAQEGIRTASAGGNRVCWMAADLANIPMGDHRADCLLNLFTPANYGEFRRVLAPGGWLVKAIPGPEHLAELRALVRDRLRHEEHSAQPVAGYFAAHFRAEERFRKVKTLSLPEELLPDLLRMTPLLFGVDQRELEGLKLPSITIDAEILTGRTEL